jgi:hypothetical protein
LLIFGGGRLAQPFLSAAPTAQSTCQSRYLLGKMKLESVWVSYNTGDYLKIDTQSKGEMNF